MSETPNNAASAPSGTNDAARTPAEPGGPRDRMIRATSRMLAERGYEATSLADVIAASGAPRGSIYHHFHGGKDELVSEAVRWQSARVDEAVSGMMRGERSAVTIVDRFVDLWRTLLLSTDYGVGCSLVGVTVGGAPAPVQLSAGEAFSAWIRTLVTALEGADIPAGRAHDTATMLLASCEGAVAIARAIRSTEPLEAVRRELRRGLADELALPADEPAAHPEEPATDPEEPTTD
jgi:TetR/AcrR family transcriptional repressor of lmrAB and yxaGH operons